MGQNGHFGTKRRAGFPALGSHVEVVYTDVRAPGDVPELRVTVGAGLVTRAIERLSECEGDLPLGARGHNPTAVPLVGLGILARNADVDRVRGDEVIVILRRAEIAELACDVLVVGHALSVQDRSDRRNPRLPENSVTFSTIVTCTFPPRRGRTKRTFRTFRSKRTFGTNQGGTPKTDIPPIPPIRYRRQFRGIPKPSKLQR